MKVLRHFLKFPRIEKDNYFSRNQVNLIHSQYACDKIFVIDFLPF